MPYEEAVNTLVKAGLLDKVDADTAVAVLASSSVDLTYPGWAESLAQAGLLDKADAEAVISTLEQAGAAEANDDPAAFEKGLENAGIF
jgi:hypothetical protein